MIKENKYKLNDNCLKAIEFIRRAEIRLKDIDRKYSYADYPTEILAEKNYLENIVKQLKTKEE
ncbi:hypothetical protein [Achromobacter xylosoxidans]|uniref:hypothetical protein n=1 Tax=Alcaligenes xylosoxydans xylosoxydans TaxID=85698 RepID=UPI001040F2ED|nr:hypothetical protein [Achromobacter xylosoxidans]